MGNTRQREIIYGVVCASPEHLDAEGVLEAARHIMPKIAVGTVYRNLAALCDAGLLRKITMPNGPDRYDKNVAPHEHILCSSCGRMFDLSVGTDEIAKLFKDEPFKITGFTLTVVGTCKNCLLRSRAPGA